MAVASPRSVPALSPANIRSARPRARLALFSAPLAALALLGPVAGARAQSACTVSGGQVTLNSGACTVPPGTVLSPSSTAITANNAQVTADGVTINPAQGGGSRGLVVTGPTGLITAGGLSLNMNGFGAGVAASATGAGTIILNSGTTINFNPGGGGNKGLLASGAGSQITTNGVTLTMPSVGGGGGNDVAVQADTGATVTLNAGSVAITGVGSVETGLFASGSGSAISTNGTTVSVTGSVSRGGFLQNGGTLTMTGGSMTTSGSGNLGFLFQAPAGVTNTLSISGTTVHSAADAFAVQGGSAAITANGATVTSDNGILLSAVQGGGAPAVVNFSADASTLTGAITTDNASTNNVTLTGGTVWNMTGNSNMTNLVNDHSLILFSAPTGDPTLAGSYKTVTATNYTGVSGQMVLNTYLGTDNSPSDKLIVNGGTAPDATTLEIRNTTGPGAETLANGIPVVQAVNGGTTAPGAFVLAPGELRAGAFTYYLFRGGIGGTNPDDWFLRSNFISPGIPPGEIEVEPPDLIVVVPPGGGGGGTEPPIAVEPPPGLTEDPPTLPEDPPPDPLPPGLFPIIGPELATYGVVQPIARQMGLATLGTLHERIGDTLTAAGAGAGSEGWTRSAWARVIGEQIEDRYRAFADPGASGRLIGFQAGLDLWLGSVIPGHRDAAGLYVAYGNADVDASGLVTNAAATGYVETRTGTVNLDAYSLGAYWTHYGPGGWYLDAVLQGSFYDGKAETQFTRLQAVGSGVITSLEAGYPIPLPLGPRFVLEPQAQILWQRVAFNQANDDFGAIDLGSTSGATGRIGLRGQWTVVSADGIVWQPYARANLWQDWDARATTSFGVDRVPLTEEGTRLELAGGFTDKIDDHLSLYLQAGYQFSVASDGGRRDGVKGDLGLRYSW